MITEVVPGTVVVVRGCRAIVNVLRIKDGTVLSSIPVNEINATINVTVNGELRMK